MSAVAFQANVIEATAKTVAMWIDATPEDRVGWKPSAGIEGAEGRSLLDQMTEVIGFNRGMLAGLTGQPLKPRDPNATEAPAWAPTTKTEARDGIVESAGALASALREMDDSVLEREIDMGGWSWKGAELISMASGHLMYHGGQICYMQTLYGDNKFVYPGMEEG